jgi:hypothetical protein
MKIIHGWLKDEPLEMHTPTLDYYFKSVTMDRYLSIRVSNARKKIGFLN